MANQIFVDLDRRFVQLDDHFVGGGDDWSLAGPGIGWDKLLTERRGMVLAEAGAGKTLEIKAAVRKLRAAGKQAFFMRLEELADGVTAASFDEPDTGSLQALEAWLVGTEAGWLMLDSVDEARLTSAKNFKRAVKFLAAKLGDAAQRANIIITSRASEWRPQSDLSLVNRYLAVAEEVEMPSEPNPDGFEPIFDAVSEKVEGGEKRYGAKVFSLLPLDEPRIRKLSAHFGVSDTRTFYDAVERADAVGFASRPKDLEDLAEYWTKNGSIGGRLELVQNDIELKLKERDRDRADKRPLSPSTARLGAKTLAAAASLLRDQQFCVPDNDGGLPGIDVGAILEKWSDPDPLTLLSRPIFDEAIYGRVRFHHRSVREFLAAEWVVDLLEKGNSRLKIEKLFFKSQYGVELVVPAMRALLPWIALKDEKFRNKIAKIAPAVLAEGGDPAAFPPEFRVALIKNICANRKQAAIGRLLDAAAVRRMATKDLGPAISELLSLYRDDEVVRITLLRMVWQGKMLECLEQANTFALDATCDAYTRTAAIQAVTATGDMQAQTELRDALLNTLGDRETMVFGECLRSFGHILETKAAIDAASRLQGPDKYGFHSLKLRFVEFVNQLALPECRTVVDEILVKLQEMPFKPGRHYRISDSAYWLLPVAASACERLVDAQDSHALSANSLELISLIQKSAVYDKSAIRTNLGSTVKAWSELNAALFWHEITNQRSDNNIVRDWWNIRGLPSFWEFSSADFGDLVEQIKLREGDDKFVALSLAVRVKGLDMPGDDLEAIRVAIGDNDRLMARLDELLDPTPTPERAEHQRQQHEHEQRMLRRDAAIQAQDARRKLAISQNLDWLRAAPSGGITGAQQDLLLALRELDFGRNRWAHPNWEGLIPEYGQEVAEAFRDGAMQYWRQYVPRLRSEGVENVNSIPNEVYLGLTGIEFESRVDGWANRLSTADVRLAVRYALWEMNGFPDWLNVLASRFGREIAATLLTEIRWEFGEDDPDGYVTYDLVWHGEQLRPLLARPIFEILKGEDPRSTVILRYALKVVSGEPEISDLELSELAAVKARSDASSGRRALWIGLWLTVQAPEAIQFLEGHISSLDAAAAKSLIMAVSSAFLSSDHDWVSKRDSFKTPSSLKALYGLFSGYIKRSEDIKRIHLRTYSPEDRDHAQRERDVILTMLGEIEGKEAFIALMQLADTHRDQDIGPYIRRAALSRAEADANQKPWTPTDFHDFADRLERTPGSPRELYEMVCDRLLDLKHDIEDADDSPADMIIGVEAETKHRTFIGKHFRDRAQGRYFAPNEEELADAKRPDIRIHGAGLDRPVAIEFKIADNWTGPELFERLRNQLVNDYLRDARSTFGVFLMTNRGVKRKHWEHPDTCASLTFDQLCISMQEHIDKYIEDRADVDGITVIGMDLTKRRQPVRPELKVRNRRAGKSVNSTRG